MSAFSGPMYMARTLPVGESAIAERTGRKAASVLPLAVGDCNDRVATPDE